MEAKELELWKNGRDISLQMLKVDFWSGCDRSFLHFVESHIGGFI